MKPWARVVPLAAAVALLVSVPASADVVLIGTTGGRSMGRVLEGQLVTRLKGLKMRSDITVSGVRLSTIVDLDAGRFIALREATREAEVHDLRAAAASLRAVADSDVTLKVTSTGETKVIGGQSCERQTIDVLVNVAPAPSEPVTMVMHGPVWIAPNSPGRQDWARFYTAVADRGLFFTDPRSVKTDPARTKALTLLFRKLAALGVPYSSLIEITFQGQGTMADLMKRTGVSTMSNELTSVSTEPVADDVFEIPAGYKITNK